MKGREMRRAAKKAALTVSQRTTADEYLPQWGDSPSRMGLETTLSAGPLQHVTSLSRIDGLANAKRVSRNFRTLRELDKLLCLMFPDKHVRLRRYYRFSVPVSYYRSLWNNLFLERFQWKLYQTLQVRPYLPQLLTLASRAQVDFWQRTNNRSRPYIDSLGIKVGRGKSL
jgi:hypothetical protein